MVEVRVNQTAELIARPFASPGTGLLEVRATLADDSGSSPLAGATVWLDGELRGVTPLRLELPRGPHSVRVTYHGEESMVQVIDLPGGNQRFATFELSATVDRPRFVSLPIPPRLPLDRPTLLSATLEGIAAPEVREMWLHVLTPEGAWRRYPMNVLKSPGGVVGAAVFPTALFDPKGRAKCYFSVSISSGDEYFTEIQPVLSAAGPRTASSP
jgi:hypothetical protein